MSEPKPTKGSLKVNKKLIFFIVLTLVGILVFLSIPAPHGGIVRESHSRLKRAHHELVGYYLEDYNGKFPETWKDVNDRETMNEYFGGSNDYDIEFYGAWETPPKFKNNDVIAYMSYKGYISLVSFITPEGVSDFEMLRFRDLKVFVESNGGVK